MSRPSIKGSVRRPRTGVSSRLGLILKRIAVGRPISTHAELHHRLNKRLGLAVFSSDALSSSAYATDEILLVLVLAGSGAIGHSIPIALAVAFVLSVVVGSYRQTVRAYPGGGGAYLVAHENLGQKAGLIAAAALLIDYVLTVSVSVAAGVAAIGAAFPTVRAGAVGVALLVVVFITLANLRGLKESGVFFSIPTYGFLVTVGGMIAYGIFKVATGNYTPLPPHQHEAETALTIFLIFRAFASGSTALTGIEAISDGVPAFKPPEARNAAQTLFALGILLTFLFVGMTFLANAYRVDPEGIDLGRTVPSQIASAIFGAGSLLFYIVQTFTALILFLAANTAYADFPRLSSILARDRYLPRVFLNRGDKLAFSNGIVLLAIAAGAVLAVTRADVHRIIPLYVIGVFTSFTLSQAGMVRRWFRLKTPRWRRSALINSVGGTTTFVVLVIVIATKFKSPDVAWSRFFTEPGGWLTILIIGLFARLLYGIREHYLKVAEKLRMDRSVPLIQSNKVVALVSPLLGASLKALAFARALSPNELYQVAFRIPEHELREIRERRKALGIKNPIEVTGHRLKDLLEFVRGLEPSDTHPVTLVIPDPQSRSRLLQVLRGWLLLRIKRMFLGEPGVVVISVPFRADIEPVPDRLRAPERFSVIVLVSGVHRATVRALEYARSLHPSQLRALLIGVEGGDAMELLDQWQSWGIPYPLEVVDSPYRSIVQPLLTEIRQLGPNPNDVVAVVVPEFIVPRWWQHFLHGQTALLVKTALLFEPNVFVIDVPHPISGWGAPPRISQEAENPGGRAP